MSRTIQVGHEICAAMFCYAVAPLDILIGGPLGEVTYIENGQVVNTIRNHTNGIIGFGSVLMGSLDFVSYGLDGQQCEWEFKNNIETVRHFR